MIKRFNFFILSTMVLGTVNVLAISSTDIQIIKDSAGYYELQNEAKLSPQQKKTCVEGDLEFNENDGFLTLGGTTLASSVAVDGKKTVTEEPSDECQEKIVNSFKGQTLEYTMTTNCAAAKTKSIMNRKINFQKEILSYVQTSTFYGKTAEVTCKLKKVTRKSYPDISEPVVNPEK